MKTHLWISLALCFTFVSRAFALSAAECSLKTGYKNCLTSMAECTKVKSRCSTTCSSNSSCSTDCCYSGYCTNEEFCRPSSTDSSSSTSDSGVSVLAILLPCLFGMLFLLLGLVFFLRWRISRQKQIASINQTNNAQNLNHQMQISNNAHQSAFKTPLDFQSHQQQSQVLGVNQIYNGNGFSSTSPSPEQDYFGGTPIGQNSQPANIAAAARNDQSNVTYI